MSDRQIIVTGASRGIGAAIAADLVNRGYAVAALSRSGEAKVGSAYRCDVTDEAAIVATIAEIAKRGPIVGLVNNAGIHRETPSHALSATDFEGLIRLHATSVVVACREVYPHLKKNNGGLIVNIGSTLERLGAVGNVSYAAAKAAVGAITRCLAVEWANDRIRVLDVAPGYIETDLNREFLSRDRIKSWIARRIPAGRPGHVNEVARLVGALFVEDIGFLTGETIIIDGGQGSSVR